MNKGPSSQSYGFSSSQVWMWELDHKEGWALKNWYFWTVVLEKTMESTVDSMEIKPVAPAGSQPWIFIGRTDAEAEALYFDHLMRTADSLENILRLGKTEGRRRRRRQRMRWLGGITKSMHMSLVNSGSWWCTGSPGLLQSTGCKVSDTTEQLDWTELSTYIAIF